MLGAKGLCFLAIAAAKATSALESSSNPDSPLLPRVITPNVSAFVDATLNSSTVPGVTMGVVRLVSTDQQPVVELAAWGRQTEEGDGHDLTPDALFALASCSKAFLVTSIGLVIDDYEHGRNATPLPPPLSGFHWDTKISELLPNEWALQDGNASANASLRDAFGHRTGLPRHDYSYKPGDTPEDVVRRLRHLPPAWDLREQWSYNNQMYMVGARIVEKYAKVSYSSFVTERIFKPLNMTSSTYSPSEAARTGRVTQTWTRGVRRIPYWFPEEVNTLFAGAGGAISNVEDMTKWLATLLNGGVDPRTNQTVVPPSTFANMTASRAIGGGADVGYGMGWFRQSYKGRDMIWHFGAIPGFSLLVAFLPADNLGVVILANMDEKQDANMGILFRVIDEALGLPRSDGSALDVQSNAQLPLMQARDVVEAPAKPEPLPLPLDIEAYAGQYANIAYGNITFCAPSSTSPYCARVHAAFAPIEAASGDPLPDARLYAAWPRVWSSHIRLRHTSGNSFGLLFPRLFPEGYGLNRTAFEFYDSGVSVGRVEFLVEDGRVQGFALVTQEEAAVARAARTNGTVKEIGDAWFDKVW